MSIGKKLRFEVFKRDSFTCQYCGKKAPDVVLHVDHIHPRSEGGEDDILNLVTSCRECNLGKGPRMLDDDSVVEKRRRQLEDLQERKEQVDMMLEWHRALTKEGRQAVDVAADYWDEVTPGRISVSDSGRKKLATMVRRFGLDDVLHGIRIAADSYIEVDDDGRATQESAERAFSKIGGICYNRQRYAKDPQAEERDREMWRFIRGYHKECSHYPDTKFLRKYWREVVEPNFPERIDGVGQTLVDACADEYYSGPHTAYWDALNAMDLPWKKGSDA